MLEKKDIASLVLLVIVSFLLSFFIANAVISTPEDRSEQVLEVAEFEPNFPSIDPRIYNENSVNPTEDIQIGDSFTPNPFRSQEDGSE